MEAINQELDRMAGASADAAENNLRRDQVGSGQRSDKRRTVRFQHDEVIDHITEKRMTIKDYMSGKMEKLWC